MATCIVTVIGNQGDPAREAYISVDAPPPGPNADQIMIDRIHNAVWPTLRVSNYAREQGLKLIPKQVVKLEPDVWVILLSGQIRAHCWCYFVRWHF